MQYDKNEIAKSILASHIMHFKIYFMVEDHGFLDRGIPPFCPTLRIAPCYYTFVFFSNLKRTLAVTL